MNTYNISTLNTLTITQLKDMLDTKAMQAIRLKQCLIECKNLLELRLVTIHLNNIKAFISCASELVKLKQFNPNNESQYSNIKTLYKLSGNLTKNN